MRRRLIPVLLLLLVLLAACLTREAEPDGAPLAASTPTPPPTAVSSPPPLTTPGAATPITTTTATQTFTIWLPADLAGRTAPAADTLLAQLAAATAEWTDVEVRIEHKAVSGQGGILSYLRTGRSVAPGILPDLVILRTDQLAAARTEGLIYPLGGQLDAARVDDLFPAARTLAQADGELIGFPVVLNGLAHLSYQPQSISGTLPTDWTQLAATPNQSLLLPATGRDGGQLGLQLYLSAGGELVNEAGQPALQLAPLTETLDRLARARADGLIMAQSTSLTTLAETWQLFLSGSGTMAVTTADLFLPTLATADSVPGYAPLPGVNGRLIPFVQGWAWAVSSADPARQALAAAVIATLTADANLGAWSFESGMLPATRGALRQWPGADGGYGAFLQRELELAAAFPPAASSTLLTVMGNAVFDVVSLTKSPQVAAEEAIETLQQ
ncbi:MAG: extracellular solute-binding protein [Anaerolineales bacterium]|nr:extracellular solute-binding protein [Anaerolineales bacterium]